MRYFFDIKENGSSTRDEDGVEFQQVDHALHEAARTAAEICMEAIPKPHARVEVSVRDASGTSVGAAVVTLAVSQAGKDVSPRE